MSAAVIVGAAVLPSVPQVLTGHDRMTVLTRLGFWVAQMLILLSALSVSYRAATRRQLGSSEMLIASVLLSGTLGTLMGLASCYLRLHFPFLRWNPERPLNYAASAAFGGVFGLFQCGIWALAFVFPFAAEDSRLRALETEKLRIEAEQLRSAAELSRLRSQLEPHFLLNTLNAIAGLVTQEPREARRLLACLGELLSDALRDAGEMQTLAEEVAWLRRYAEILESRHRGALSFSWDIADAAAGALVPRLLLQPLLENAVKHGALRRRGAGRVSVRARITSAGPAGPRLLCSIEDNGPGIAEKAPRPGALGLFSVRRRLELRYADAELRLQSSPEGARAVVDIPYQRGEAPPRPAPELPRSA